MTSVGQGSEINEVGEGAGPSALYFAHIPKTAGTSFIAVLDRLYAQEQICPAQLWRELATVSPQQLKKYRLFRGHFGGYGLDPLLGCSMDRMTLLREPIARSISTFRFIRREPGSRVHRYVMDHDMSLRQFASDPVTSIKITNEQTRQLAFSLVDNADRDLWVSDASVAVVDQWVDKNRQPAQKVDQRRRAQTFLRTCKFLGLTERFNDSMDLFAFTFELPALGRLHSHRRSAPVERPDAATERQLEALNDDDLQLYQQGCQEFDRRLGHMDRALAAFRKRSDVDRHAALQRRFEARKPRRVWAVPSRYRFSQPLVGAGWQQRELKTPEGDWFRWTGPDCRSKLWFSVRRQAPRWTLQLRTVDEVQPGVIDTLDVLVNDSPVAMAPDHTKDAVRVYRGSFDGTLLHSGMNHVCLEVASVSRRDDDQRDLGIAVHWIELNACSLAT